MTNLFQPNITTKGRVLRAVISLVFLAIGIFAASLPWVIRISAFGAAAFTAFEAGRGWCLLRACGIRTRL